MTRWGRIWLVGVVASFLLGCSGRPTEPVAAKAPPPEKIEDEAHKFAKEGLVEAKVVEADLPGQDFMPGGNLAEYEAGGKKYQMFFTKRKDNDQALFLFMDYKEKLADPKFVPHFGGYFGDNEGVPTFVFQKNSYVIGVTGLDEAAADKVARVLAAKLN